MIFQANDKFRTALRSTWISSPASTSLLVGSVPDHVPTIVVVGWNTSQETVFTVEGKTGDSPANYALTGVTRLRGANVNLPENSAVNILNNEEFFNQYSALVNDQYLQMGEQGTAPGTPATSFLRLYAGTDGKWHVKNDAGVVATLGELSDEWIDVAYNTTMNFNLGSLTNKLKFLTGALTGNPTFTVSNTAEGLVFMVRIAQDATGSRIPVWFDVVTDTVTMTLAAPGLITTTKDIKTGTPVKFTNAGGALPTGITAGTVYYWIRTAATTGNIALTKAAAIAGTTITTSGSQSGVHTMKVQISWAGGEVPTLTTTKHAWDDFGFIVHSVNQISGVIVAQDI